METSNARRGPSRDAADRKDKILDVAEELFAEKGFAATSMRHVAQAAGVNVATLYYHCGSKEELFVSIYGRVVQRMGTWVAETFDAGKEFRSIVVELIDKVVEYFAQHPSIPRLLLRSDLGEMPGTDEQRHKVYQPLFATVAQVMQARVERGEIRQIEPAAFVTAATGVIAYLAMSLTKTSKADEVKIDPKQLKVAQRHARMFILGALGLDPEDAS